jgi:hypothetical protein
VNSDALENKDDKLSRLGFGIISFLKLLRNLAGMFILISVIHIPLVYMYSKGDFKSSTDLFTAHSVGNLGQAETRCIFSHLV